MDKEELNFFFELPTQGLWVNIKLLRHTIAMGLFFDHGLRIFQADHNITQWHAGHQHAQIFKHRKGEHIGGFVFLAPLRVELLNGVVVTQNERDLYGVREIQGAAVIYGPRPQLLFELIGLGKLLGFALNQHVHVHFVLAPWCWRHHRC